MYNRASWNNQICILHENLLSIFFLDSNFSFLPFVTVAIYRYAYNWFLAIFTYESIQDICHSNFHILYTIVNFNQIKEKPKYLHKLYKDLFHTRNEIKTKSNAKNWKKKSFLCLIVNCVRILHTQAIKQKKKSSYI